MFQAPANKPEHDKPQRFVMILGFLSSSACCFLGYPCATPGYITLAFRGTCVGYFSCNLLPYLLGPCPFSHGVLRLALIINSISSWIVSAFWCVGFGEWVLLMLMVEFFQAFGAMVLLETDVQPHVFLTLAGNIVAYLFRVEASPDSTMDPRYWAACTVTVVVLLVIGMWNSQHRHVEFLKRKFRAMSEILNMSTEEMEQIPEKGLVSTPLKSRSTGSSQNGFVQEEVNKTNCWIEDLETLHCVGQGAFGQVHFCRWKGMDAAVKVMTWQQKKKSKVNPVREAELCLKLRHPNLVETYTFFTREIGTKATVREMWIIQEWCDLGTLNNYAASQRPYEKPNGKKQILQIMTEVCKATAYLHEKEVIHSDLTSNNVLLQSTGRKAETFDKTITEDSEEADFSSFTCKVCDFGMARVLEEGITELLTSQLGTVSHMPPELLHIEERRLSKKADIWAIGMLLYETVVGDIPYKGMMVPSIILFVASGKRLSLPDHVEEAFRDLFERCGQADLDTRPSAEELLTFLAEQS